MNNKQIALLASSLGILVLLLLALSAQAQGYTCAGLERLLRDGTTLLPAEREFYDENCEEEEEEFDWEAIPTAVVRDPSDSCYELPPRVAVFGHVYGTECRMLREVGVGRWEVLDRGYIDAVDVWSYVNGGIEVCFRDSGWLVFLDAAYAPRMIVELESFERDGMTCGAIDGAGTVVLVEQAPPPDPDATPAPPAKPSLPTFEAIPLSDCLIKLVETLFLRAEPAGEIIGLVWQFSEVPAFEINGFWYKVEFEGQTGFVSRYHRKVLRGGCG